MAAGARWVDGPRLDLAAVGDNGQRVRIGWHLDFFAIFIYFRIFVFACEQHKHPHIKVRFSRVGAPLTWKSYDFRRHFRQMDRRLTVKMSFGRMKE